MIDTDKYENMRQLFLDLIDSASDEIDEEAWKNKLTMLDELLAEVKRLQKENKILAKYMDIVNKYDDALLADGDTDPRWSELYD